MTPQSVTSLQDFFLHLHKLQVLYLSTYLLKFIKCSVFHYFHGNCFHSVQSCKLRFRLRKLTSCLWSAAVRAVCFEGSAAGLDATETGNAVSQLTFDFTSLEILVEVGTQNLSDLISSFPFRLNHSQYKHDCSLQ